MRKVIPYSESCKVPEPGPLGRMHFKPDAYKEAKRQLVKQLDKTRYFGPDWFNKYYMGHWPGGYVPMSYKKVMEDLFPMLTSDPTPLTKEDLMKPRKMTGQLVATLNNGDKVTVDDVFYAEFGTSHQLYVETQEGECKIGLALVKSFTFTATTRPPTEGIVVPADKVEEVKKLIGG